ncbi:MULTISPECIES: hypothetical protein [unclassified Dolichospermum]|uniref:hypothetical protein n=1 Tax=unclassified Dolichospermum TaxID=2622029 RepID=UPI0014475C97|nr:MULTISPECIES: hypothetical protein [unclassified Dolichospermum]MTJ15794.1 hypothetical protein [Dolichospermum sp. UHCC 0299]MTJ38198.1 hypothetical protein [Dolichospermum sp. UHCC 0406]
MKFQITPENTQNKCALLEYFRELGNEKLSEIKREVDNEEYQKSTKKYQKGTKKYDKNTKKYKEKITSDINTAINTIKKDFFDEIIKAAIQDNWDDQDKLSSLLFTTYCTHVVMLDLRHEVWPYEYMAFSRRIGELWEEFVKLPFLYPPKAADLTSFEPKTFSQVRENIKSDTEKHINILPISQEQKIKLINDFENLWLVIDSGKISLKLDFHAIIRKKRFNIDFKSGFGSNEKGNTNRLLMVPTIYSKLLEDEYSNILLVRAKEELNNNYFKQLKQSGVWNAYCGDEAYEKIGDFTTFDIQTWINSNIDWQNDLLSTTVSDFQKCNLMGYLQW